MLPNATTALNVVVASVAEKLGSSDSVYSLDIGRVFKIRPGTGLGCRGGAWVEVSVAAGLESGDSLYRLDIGWGAWISRERMHQLGVTDSV